MNNGEKPEEKPFETEENITGEVAAIISPMAIEAMTRGEIDIQISTAKRYPRTIELFLRNAIDMAIIDEETAEACIYCREVGSKWNPETRKMEKKYAEGYSIRLAEIAVCNYQNIRWGSMIVEMTERFVRARGFCHDLEKNVLGFAEVVESTVKQDGKPYSERMRIVVAKSAAAKAMRDAVWKVIPGAIMRPVERKIREIVGGEEGALTTSKRRARVMAWLSQLGIDIERVWSALGIVGENDLTSVIIIKLAGIRTSIKENDCTVNEAFPPILTAGKHKIGEQQKEADAGKPLEKPKRGRPSKEAKSSTPAAEKEDTEPPPEEDTKPITMNLDSSADEASQIYEDTLEGIRNAGSLENLASIEKLFWGRFANKISSEARDKVGKAFTDRKEKLEDK